MKKKKPDVEIPSAKPERTVPSAVEVELLKAAGEYLKSIGCTVAVIGVDRILQPPLLNEPGAAFNFELVLRFTGTVPF